jgi:AraC-like DNA-binding protein
MIAMKGRPSARQGSSPPALGPRVRQIVTALLADGSSDIHPAAEKMGISVRTLQRWLRAAGLTYAGVAREARCELARQMLEQSERKIRDVAVALGYSDPAHFTRAFQRWTGLTPRDFRRRSRGAIALAWTPKSRGRGRAPS